jgi:RNA polymerase-binding transcription factor DksA
LTEKFWLGRGGYRESLSGIFKNMKIQKEFSKFEEASKYAKEVAKKLGSNVSVARTEKGWMVKHEVLTNRSFDIKTTNDRHSVKSLNKIITEKKTSKETSKKLSRAQTNITSSPKHRFCIDCGNLISQARVEAVHNVQRCTKCQSLNER